MLEPDWADRVAHPKVEVDCFRGLKLEEEKIQIVGFAGLLLVLAAIPSRRPAACDFTLLFKNGLLFVNYTESKLVLFDNELEKLLADWQMRGRNKDLQFPGLNLLHWLRVLQRVDYLREIAVCRVEIESLEFDLVT
jgi:hypothetical protein